MQAKLIADTIISFLSKLSLNRTQGFFAQTCILTLVNGYNLAIIFVSNKRCSNYLRKEILCFIFLKDIVKCR